jgi:hypothetical protein
MCGATSFFSEMTESILSWWQATKVSVVDQDGAESGTPCANASHLHHHGINDSIWQQYKSVRALFNAYLAAPIECVSIAPLHAHTSFFPHAHELTYHTS